MRRDRIAAWAHASWVDLVWVAFVGLNLLAMRLLPGWQTVPFLVIWLSLTALYGFRLWRLGSTLVTVGVITLATGGLIGWQVSRGKQDADYLAEVPLLAMMFVVMVWHARRRVAAMEEIKRVSEQNLRLLDQQRQFLQDASHELGTPITIALGHAELIARAATDQGIASDARVAVDELLRMRRLTGRMLLLASTDGPDFLRPAPVNVAELILATLDRWSYTPRRWSLGPLADASVPGDEDRLTLALDALIENAVNHTEADDRIELSSRREGDEVILTVADSGSGIPAGDVWRIFGRFSRVDSGRNRTAGGFGLGLAVVKAIAEAHNGSVHVQTTMGQGSAFELHLPASDAEASPAQPLAPRRAVRRAPAAGG
jgi:signal transduction histidine kinase